MNAYLKLVRFPNLLIIAFTQYMMRLFLVEPILNLSGLYLKMPDWQFALLVLATVLISAAGYIINDYFDVRIDNINKPDVTVIDKDVSRRTAIGAHAFLSGLGVAIGIFVSWRCNILMAGGTLFAVSVIALWYYSVAFKSQFLIGNVIISLLTGMVAFMVPLFDLPPVIAYFNNTLAQQKADFGTTTVSTVLLWSGCYAMAAFGLSMIREIIKDMEDVEGDKEYGCKTIPIVLGIQKSKFIVSTLILIFMTGIGYVMYHQYTSRDMLSFYYFLALVELPLVFVFFKTIYATNKKDFHTSGTVIKLTMLTGICFLFLLKYLLSK
jgi:4-hydroxybenzoate polyprenyltransferase